MNAFAKLICIGFVLAVVQVGPAIAGSGHKKVAVQPHLDKVDKATVEKRLEDRGLRSKKRSEQAKKAAQERHGKNPVNPPKP